MHDLFYKNTNAMDNVANRFLSESWEVFAVIFRGGGGGQGYVLGE